MANSCPDPVIMLYSTYNIKFAKTVQIDFRLVKAYGVASNVVKCGARVPAKITLTAIPSMIAKAVQPLKGRTSKNECNNDNMKHMATTNVDVTD